MSTEKSLLEQKLEAWTARYPAERDSLLGFLMVYGSAIPAAPTDTLDTLLTAAYTTTAKRWDWPLEKLLSWIFEPDNADDVSLRLQVST